MMVCRKCQSDGIIISRVVERRIEHSIPRYVCVRCATPVTCRSFVRHTNGREVELIMDDVLIQFLDKGRTWRTAAITINQSQRIISEMRLIQSRYPDSRVRAVNKSGQLIDILE